MVAERRWILPRRPMTTLCDSYHSVALKLCLTCQTVLGLNAFAFAAPHKIQISSFQVLFSPYRTPARLVELCERPTPENDHPDAID
jgi:hypothetical protein